LVFIQSIHPLVEPNKPPAQQLELAAARVPASHILLDLAHEPDEALRLTIPREHRPATCDPIVNVEDPTFDGNPGSLGMAEPSRHSADHHRAHAPAPNSCEVVISATFRAQMDGSSCAQLRAAEPSYRQVTRSLWMHWSTQTQTSRLTMQQ
jgi:hypothetical protein